MSDGFVDLEDGRLWYERAGGGFPVVFVHSGVMDARIWEPRSTRRGARNLPRRPTARMSSGPPRW
jgi:pimeloyl-ACP methyl ester carboxylesterase